MPDQVVHTNPIVPGFAPDPSVIFVDGVYTTFATPHFTFSQVCPSMLQSIFKSNAINRPEQVNLAGAGSISIMTGTPNQMILTLGLFAPTIRYHRGTFYVVCTNAYKMTMPFALQNFVVSTTDIWSGKWSDPVNIDFAGFDPSIFFDDDDRVYFQGAFNLDRQSQPSGTIKQMEIDINTGAALSELKEIWWGHTRHDTEGPHLYKRDNCYYLVVAEGGTFKNHMLCIARSENIWGPYGTFAGNPFLTTKGTDGPIQNIGHGELFQDQDSRWWVAGLGVRVNRYGYSPLGRETFLISVDWPEGGWPKCDLPTQEFTRASIKSSTWQHAFPKRRSPPQDARFLYIRTPKLSNYVLPKGNESVFILRPSRATMEALEGTCTFVGVRQRSISATASAIISLANRKSLDGVEAGLAMYKDHLRYASLNYNFEKDQVSCRIVNSSTNLYKHSYVGLDGSFEDELKLQINATATDYHFLIAWAAGWKEIASISIGELVSQEMTGPVFGILATTSGEEDDGKEILFSEFQVRAE